MTRGGPRRAIFVPLAASPQRSDAAAQSKDAHGQAVQDSTLHGKRFSTRREIMSQVAQDPTEHDEPQRVSAQAKLQSQAAKDTTTHDESPPSPRELGTQLYDPPALLSDEEEMEPAEDSKEGSGISRALMEMRDFVTRRWGSVNAGAQFLSTCDIDGNGHFGVQSLHACLKEEGYPRSLGEVCCLFMALGVPCSVHAKLTAEDFLRMRSIEGNMQKHADSVKRVAVVFGALQLLRVTLGNITPPELMLTLIYMGFSRECGEIPPETKPTLQQALSRMRRYLFAFVGISQALCDALTSSLGLQILSRVITSAHVEKSLKLEAVTLLSHAIAVTGGPPFEVQSVVDQAVMDKWSAKGYEHLQNLLQFPGAPTSGPGTLTSARSTASPRAKTGEKPPGGGLAYDSDLVAVASFAEHLAREFWHPVLVALDAAHARGPKPIDNDVLDALMVVYRQMHLTHVLISPECRELLTPVEGIVQLLRQHSDDPLDDCDVIMDSLDLLEEMHGAVSSTITGREVHTLLAAYGGYRFLADRLAKFTMAEAADPTAGAVAELSQRWCTEKDKLLRRWRPAKQVGAMAKLGALARAVTTASAGGFQEVWQAVLTGTEQLGATVGGGRMVTLPTAWHPVGQHGRGIERKLLMRLANRWERARSPEFAAREEELNELVGHEKLLPKSGSQKLLPQAPLSARGRLFATPWKVDTAGDEAVRSIQRSSKGSSTETGESTRSAGRPRPKNGRRGVDGWSYSALKWPSDDRQSDEQQLHSARKLRQQQS